MASKSFLNQFNDLDFTNEEQGAIFTPAIPWDSVTEDSHLTIIGKLISSNPVDDNAVVRAFQGIWKNDKIVHITSLKPRYYRIKFPTEDIRNDILARGPWTFKGGWLALAASNPDNSIDDYTFFTMNVWIRIYGIPSVLMEDDDTANHIGNSLDVAAVNTPNRSIPRAANVTTDSISDKHPSMAAATEPGVTTKALSVADIAPVGAKLANAAMMETLSHTKDNDPDPILVSTPPVDVNNKAQIDKVLESSTNDSLGSTMVPTLNNLEEPEGFIDFLNTTNETSSEVPYLLDNVGMDAAPNTLLPIPREGGLEYDLGKSFLATSNMLDIFDAWISNQSFPHTAKIDEESPLLIPRGTKRRLSMPHDSKFKKAKPPPIISKTRAGMSSVKNSSADVVSQPRRGK
ncbi:hypothetical protein V6N13_116010 [Hibiscus sabdariffa]